MHPPRPLSFLIFPAEGIDNHWNAICLDFNVWSSADSIQAAAELIEDAVLVSLEDCDPAAFEPADPALWARASAIIDLVQRGEGMQREVSEMDACRGRITHGVFFQRLLTHDGEWRIGLPAVSPPAPRAPSIPQAA